MSPKVTIIIPCYNSEKWIEECIMSALNQTYDNKEVIFVDNESSDSSLEIAKRIQETHKELVVETAENIYKHSYQEPVEKALSISTGEYATILGSDDFIDEDYIKNIAEILSKSDKISVLQSPVRGVKGVEKTFVGEISHSYKNLQQFKEQLFIRCPVTTPTIVFKKSLYDSGIVRWKSEEYLGACDYELYFNLTDNNVFIYPFPKWIGYYYRWHEDQCTWGMHKEETNFDQKIKDYWRNKWTQT